jgi:hypothetical protein
MSYDTVNNILWPYDRPNTEWPRCESCGEAIHNDDPAEIDGKTFCDFCASDYSWLRNQGYIISAKERTRQLVKQAKEKLSLIDYAYQFFGHKH